MQHTVPGAPKVPIFARISRNTIDVIAPVNLYGQFKAGRNKICDVVSDGKLPFEGNKTCAVAKPGPEPGFGKRLCGAIGGGAVDYLSGNNATQSE